MLGGTPAFIPNPNHNGVGSFEYVITDGLVEDVGLVTVTIDPVDDVPVAADQNLTLPKTAPATLVLSASDVDLPVSTLTFTVDSSPGHGTLGSINQLSATTASVVYTPNSGYVGTDSFTFTAGDTDSTSAPATISLTMTNTPFCGDGLVELPETCDDLGQDPGDGCAINCQTEEGWTCGSMPSVCTPICNDGVFIEGSEECDDGNPVDTDGCTTQCVATVLCSTQNTSLAAGDRFSTDPETGTCYVAFDDEVTTFAAAQAACQSSGGNLVAITSAAEQGRVQSVQNPAQNPWIGGTDAAVEGSFSWLTGEVFGFTHHEPGQPDSGGGVVDEDCLHLVSSAAPSGQAGRWEDVACDDAGVVGRVCEIQRPR